MNCLIVDDHEIARSTLKQLIRFEESLTLMGECENAADAYKAIANQKIDLIFLDVEMPDISGIDLVKGLGDKRPLIVFISANRDYAADAYDLNVVDFITKPVTLDRFLKSIIKAKDIFKNKDVFVSSKQDEFIFIRDSSIIRRIKITDIEYFEAKGDYVRIGTANKVYAIYSSLKSVESKLPGDFFLRVHRSFIVNVGKIDTVEGSTLTINKSFIPVSDAYKAVLNKRMQIL